MKVRVNDPGWLPRELRAPEGPREFEVLGPNDPRVREGDRWNDSVEKRYLLVMPTGIGHMAYTTVTAWWVPKNSCTVLEERS